MTGPEPVAETGTDRDALVERLRAVIEWVSERDHNRAVELDTVVHELEALAVVEQTDLMGMTVEDGAAALSLRPPRALVIAWVDAARKMLGDAPNYSETRIDFPGASMEVKAAGELERYIFTVQRAGKITPHEARVAAETERDSLRAEVAAVRTLTDGLAANARLMSPTETIPVPSAGDDAGTFNAGVASGLDHAVRRILAVLDATSDDGGTS